MPLVDGKCKSQSNGSKDAPKQRERDHSYDATTDRQRGGDNSHASVFKYKSTKSSTGWENLSFFRSPRYEPFPTTDLLSLSKLECRGSRICLRWAM